jgi:hypothetical protein
MDTIKKENIMNEEIKGQMEDNLTIEKIEARLDVEKIKRQLDKLSIRSDFIRSEDDFQVGFGIKAPKANEPSYFHYKKFESAYDFIDKKYIRLSALSNFVAPFGDEKEYEHFFEVVNMGFSKSFIDEQKNELCIFCLTNDYTNECFWKKYTEDYNGLCIEMDFKFEGKEELIDKFEFRKVSYDDGSDFRFYAELKDRIYAKYKKLPLPNGIAKFAAFYKREQYKWENETRLLIDKRNWGKKTSENFLEVPFENELFTIKIKSITVGKHLTPCKKEKIMELASQRGIPIKTI